MSERVHTVVIDFDGTLAPSAWPHFPDTLMPGAREAMQLLHGEGIKLTVNSARLNPHDPFTMQERDKATMRSEVMRMRDLLDREGLTFIDIWTMPGKPGATVYVDDRGLWYPGRPGSWAKTAQKILLRCGKEEAAFPPFDQEVALAGE